MMFSKAIPASETTFFGYIPKRKSDFSILHTWEAWLFSTSQAEKGDG